MLWEAAVPSAAATRASARAAVRAPSTEDLSRSALWDQMLCWSQTLAMAAFRGVTVTGGFWPGPVPGRKGRRGARAPGRWWVNGPHPVAGSGQPRVGRPPGSTWWAPL